MKNVLQPAQIASWIERNFPDNKPRRGGAEIRINNPFDGDTGYHFNISVDKGACHDWRGDSGWVGIDPRSGKRNKCTFLKFVQIYRNCSFLDALQDVLGGSSDAASILRTLRSTKKQKDKEEVSLELPGGTEPIIGSPQKGLASGLLAWLRGRGIDKGKIEKYKMMHAGFEIVWPYYEYDERVYWQTRSRMDKRFRFPPEDVGASRRHFIYGFDNVEPASHLVIVEALFDCQTLEEQCVATGGASLSLEQVQKIKLLGPKDGIILAPDNDEAGIKSILSNANMLKSTPYSVFYSIPPEIEYETSDGGKDVTKDWNDLGRYGGVKWDDVRGIMEERAVPLDTKGRIALTRMMSRAVW